VPSEPDSPRPAAPRIDPTPPELGVRDVLAPKRGFSGTELLLGVNLIVSFVLFARLGASYGPALHEWAVARWNDVHAHAQYGWFVPTLFLHAGVGHLTSNLIALAIGGGVVEFLAGKRWTVAVYLLTGFGAAWISYTGHAGPPLSIGASGAIMGLVGCAVSFLIRRRRLFNYAQRWKVWRVYVPLSLLVFLPTLVRADVHAHAGGFACGVALGFLVPPHERVARLAAYDSLRDDDPAEEPASPSSD